jgi:hypothetical protein
MTIERIKTDVIYEHEKYGEVLVTGIGKMYSEWSIDGPKDGIESGNVLVYFYDNYDGYGGMSPMPFSETADEFTKSCKQEVGDHDYIEMDYDEDES